jgi:hypothetical protein
LAVAGCGYDVGSSRQGVPEAGRDASEAGTGVTLRDAAIEAGEHDAAPGDLQDAHHDAVAPADASTDAASPGEAGIAGVPANDLVLWLRADRGVTAQGGRISSWGDQSGNGADAVQSVAASQPTLASDAGVPAVSFDGVAEFLTLPDIDAPFSRGLSIFAAVNIVPQQSGCSALLELSAGTESDDISLGDFLGAAHFEVKDAVGEGAPIAADRFHLMSVIHSVPGSAEMRLDGASTIVTVAPMARDTLRTTNFVGRTLVDLCTPLSGRVYELVLYSRAVSGAEVTAIESALRSRWAQ